MGVKVFCHNCQNLRTDGPCDQYYYYCALDEGKGGYERVTAWHERAGNEGMKNELDGTCENAREQDAATNELDELLREHGIPPSFGRNMYSKARNVKAVIGGNSVTATENLDGTLYVEGRFPKLSPEDVVKLLEVLNDDSET